MTKRHFEAMADYIADLRQHPSSAQRGVEDRVWLFVAAGEQAAVYKFALYLCNKFGKNFDRARFDAWIEKKAQRA